MPAVILSPIKDWRLALAALLQQRGVQCMATDDLVEAVGAARGVGGAVIVAHAQCGGDDLRVLLRSAARSEGSPVAIAGPWSSGEPEFEALITARFEQAFAFLEIVDWVEDLVPAHEVMPPAGLETARALSASGSFLLTFDGSDALAGPTPDEDARAQWEADLGSLDVQTLLTIARHESDGSFLGLSAAPRSPSEVDQQQKALEARISHWETGVDEDAALRRPLQLIRGMVRDSADTLRWQLATDSRD